MEAGISATAVAAACVPTIALFSALVALYACASGPDLERVLRDARATRLRQKRRGHRAPRSRFRPKQKLSQDGKGGRSANS